MIVVFCLHIYVVFHVGGSSFFVIFTEEMVSGSDQEDNKRAVALCFCHNQTVAQLGILINQVIFRPAENESDWSFSGWTHRLEISTVQLLCTVLT